MYSTQFSPYQELISKSRTSDTDWCLSAIIDGRVFQWDSHLTKGQLRWVLSVQWAPRRQWRWLLSEGSQQWRWHYQSAPSGTWARHGFRTHTCMNMAQGRKDCEVSHRPSIVSVVAPTADQTNAHSEPLFQRERKCGLWEAVNRPQGSWLSKVPWSFTHFEIKDQTKSLTGAGPFTVKEKDSQTEPRHCHRWPRREVHRAPLYSCS